VGELPTTLQVKLLRFLQDRKIDRLGGTKPIEVNVRIISATNQSLEELVKTGQFREDLFYRVSVININLPPLRDRGDDIILLAQTFLEIAGREQKRESLTLAPRAESAIRRYAWPGNVRELENKIRRAALLARSNSVGPSDLALSDSTGTARDLGAVRDEAERGAIVQALATHGGNVTRAARELGVSRTTLYGLMRKHDIQSDK